MRYKKIDIKIAVNDHPKEAQPLQQSESERKRKNEGVEKRKLVSKGSARGLKLNCRSKAKQSPNLT